MGLAVGVFAASPISFIFGLVKPAWIYPFWDPTRVKASLYSLIFFPALGLLLAAFAADLGFKPGAEIRTLFVMGILLGLSLPFLLPYLRGLWYGDTNYLRGKWTRRGKKKPSRQCREKTGRRRKKKPAFTFKLQARAVLPDGMSKSEFEEVIQKAKKQIEQIRNANRDIPSQAATKRMNAIIDKASEIIKQFLKDPSRIHSADKFLDIYLGSVAAIAEKYAETHQLAVCKKLDGQFLDLLGQIDMAFAEQKRQLMNKDVLHLDVDMELLSMRLKREGL